MSGFFFSNFMHQLIFIQKWSFQALYHSVIYRKQLSLYEQDILYISHFMSIFQIKSSLAIESFLKVGGFSWKFMGFYVRLRSENTILELWLTKWSDYILIGNVKCQRCPYFQCFSTKVLSNFPSKESSCIIPFISFFSLFFFKGVCGSPLWVFLISFHDAVAIFLTSFTFLYNFWV